MRCFNWRSDGWFRRSAISGWPASMIDSSFSDADSMFASSRIFFEQLVGQALRLVDDERGHRAGRVAGVASISVSSARQRVFDVAASALRPKPAARNSMNSSRVSAGLFRYTTRLWRTLCDCSAAWTSVVLPVPASPTSSAMPVRADQAVLERRQRLAVLRGHQQEARVRRQLERPLAKAVEASYIRASP